MAHYLYRHFDVEGKLLYVGISCNPLVRTTLHRFQSPWLERVRNITLEAYNSKPDVLAAEATAIWSEKPEFNRYKIREPRKPTIQPQEKTERDINLVGMRLMGLTLEAIGVHCGLTRARVGQIIKKRRPDLGHVVLRFPSSRVSTGNHNISTETQRQGGLARALSLSPRRRRAIAMMAAKARWAKVKRADK